MYKKDTLAVVAVPDGVPGMEQAKPFAISRTLMALAFAVAIASDLISVPLGLFPFLEPVEIGLDILTAIALSVIFRELDLILALGFMLELPPFISMLPWWTLVVVAKWRGYGVNASTLRGLLGSLSGRMK